MTHDTTEIRSVVVERELAFPPQKIWRALTEPHLIGEWLMKTDFAPVLGHAFTLNAAWGSVNCKILAIEPNKSLSYTWVSSGLESVVTWTITPTPTGSLLQMEQTGFLPDQEQAYQGAKHGWRRFLTAMEQVLAQED